MSVNPVRMSSQRADITERVEQLLAAPEHASHPLRLALEELYASHKQQLQRIERITRISDQYQSNVHSEKVNATDRFEKSLKQLERITRISDRYQKILQDLNTELKHASTHDHLTALANRRLMVDRLAEEADRAVRTGRTFAIVIMDIDHFKAVNDSYGHDAGDAVLIAYSRLASAQLREYDLICRWGGEEFLALLPETTMEEALNIAGRLRATAAENVIDVSGTPVAITASLGVAVFTLGEDVGNALKRADAALYVAKEAGRNCVRGS